MLHVHSLSALYRYFTLLGWAAILKKITLRRTSASEWMLISSTRCDFWFGLHMFVQSFIYPRIIRIDSRMKVLRPVDLRLRNWSWLVDASFQYRTPLDCRFAINMCFRFENFLIAHIVFVRPFWFIYRHFFVIHSSELGDSFWLLYRIRCFLSSRNVAVSECIH